MTPLLPLSEALEQLLASTTFCPEVVQVSLKDALGKILAQDQYAVIDVPPADNSAMDGFALRASDAGRKLPVTGRIAAGDAGAGLGEDGVARIFTGAEIPTGADAVVMQEDVHLVEGVAELPGEIRTGQHIRRKGQDCRVGSRLLAQGRRLRPQDLGLLASQGIGQVAVFQKLTVALLSTGNELREPGSGELPPGAIYNSNRPMLCGLLSAVGCEVVDLGIVRDTAESTREALLAGAASADVIVSSGGVSVGEADHVRDAVTALGKIALWRIAIKPGKPFAFGHVASTPFIGLPGNPSSAFVTFLLLARPYLLAMQGRREVPAIPLEARADFTVANPGSRQEFLRVLLSQRGGEIWAVPHANQSSGVLTSLSASDALAVVPVGQTIEYGQFLETLRLDELLQ